MEILVNYIPYFPVNIVANKLFRTTTNLKFEKNVTAPLKII